MTKHYDFLIAGGGAAGLGLAYALMNSPLADCTMLILERDTKKQNDRTWCFWSKRPTLYDAIYYRSWHKLRFVAPGFERVFDLGEYRYNMVRGIDFYNHTLQDLQRRSNVAFYRGEVPPLQDAAGVARVMLNDEWHSAFWAFDSILRSGDMTIDPYQYHDVKQHFRGWEIETEEDVFDPELPTLFDFRTPQDGAMRFFYILPFSPRRALVEYTLFSPHLLSEDEYNAALVRYIADVLKLQRYTIVEKEQGVIPMTDWPFQRRNGFRILNIGTKGGRVKPSTGYAFLRIQDEAQAIVQSLLQKRHPFALPQPSLRYRFYDRVMLQVMTRHGGRCAAVFTQMFRNNPIERIFSFLDEDQPFRDDLRLMISLPVPLFAAAAFKTQILGRV